MNALEPRQRYLESMPLHQWRETILRFAEYHDWKHVDIDGLLVLRHDNPDDILCVEPQTEAGKSDYGVAAWLAALEAKGLECAVWRPSQTDIVAQRLRRRGR